MSDSRSKPPFRTPAPPTRKTKPPSGRPVQHGMPGSPAGGGGRKRTVLVVEDDEKARLLLVRALSTRYTVHEAADGEAAAALLESVGAIDMLVCDVMMPKMDGIALTKLIKSKPALKGIPILILSARTDAQDVIKGISAGARHYMTKPYSVKELLERVARAIGE